MFEAKRVFIVGSGASLTGFDFAQLKGEKVITINHAYRLCPHDLHVFYDASFLAEARGVYNPKTHTSKVLCGRSAGPAAGENIILFRRSSAVTKQFKDGLYMGYSSALPAVNAALIYGAREVYLLGIDCKFLTASEVREAAKRNGNPAAADAVLNGSTFAHHVTQNEVKHTMNTMEKERKYHNMAAQFNAFHGMPVYNLSQFSNLTLPFRKVDSVLKKQSKKEGNNGNNELGIW